MHSLRDEDNPPDERVLTNSRWQNGNNVPRYDKRQTQAIDLILARLAGFNSRGAKI